MKETQMKITVEDVNAIMFTSRSATELTPQLKDLITELNELMVNSKYWTELASTMSTMMLAKSIESGKMDILTLVGNTSQMGIMAGASIGFQLGLREAGLAFGIGTPTPMEDDPTNKC
jgi:hypothetical protein